MSLLGLEEALAVLARQRALISYGALARQLAVPGPGSIAKLSAALELTMADDTKHGRPLRAALCHARGGGLPAKGFFDAAQRLGRFNGGDPAGFTADERAALFNAAALR